MCTFWNPRKNKKFVVVRPCCCSTRFCVWLAGCELATGTASLSNNKFVQCNHKFWFTTHSLHIELSGGDCGVIVKLSKYFPNLENLKLKQFLTIFLLIRNLSNFWGRSFYEATTFSHTPRRIARFIKVCSCSRAHCAACRIRLTLLVEPNFRPYIVCYTATRSNKNIRACFFNFQEQYLASNYLKTKILKLNPLVMGH